MPSRRQNRFFTQNAQNIDSLARTFSGHASVIDVYKIRNWLSQFSDDHLDIGLKLLRNVLYYDYPAIVHELKILHETLKQINENRRTMLLSSLGAVGTSSGALMHAYRLANHLTRDQFDRLFASPSTLTNHSDRDDIMLVFVDDLVGTGNQFIDAWMNLQGVINEENEVYVGVICATEGGIERIERETDGRVNVVCNRTLGEDDKIFSNTNPNFTAQEKGIIRRYCIAAGSEPEGFGNCQLSLIFHYRAPNNVISILRSNNQRWKGLFVRDL